MGIDWNLAHRYLPHDRHAYPRAVFASLWTLRPEDADQAYRVYAEERDRGRHDHRTIFRALGGRPFRVPALEATPGYRDRWDACPWPANARGELAAALGTLGGDAFLILRALVTRKRPALISAVSYGIEGADAAAQELAAAGLVVIEPAPPGKGKHAGDCLLRWEGPPRELAAWEAERRDWLAERLYRDQYAYEATQSALRTYRESGVVAGVEVLGCPDSCPACRQLQRVYPLAAGIELPVLACTHPNGCRCAVAPIVES